MNNLLLRPRDKTTALAQATFAFVLLALLLFGAPASAETVVEEINFDDAEVSVEPIEPLPVEELAELVAPIALYPDDLIAIVLPASTYPLQIVQAARFLEARKDDQSLEPSEDWDDSIIALLNYPEVLELMNSDLDWTWKLGEAVLVQQDEVIAAVGDFRERARVAGNLQSDEHQIVEVGADGTIEIRPADPEVIYVPYYEPSRVTVYHDYPVYRYYPHAYPVYYYPYPSGYAFSSGYFWGVTSAFSIGWSTHRLHLHHYGYNGHPYYGRRYYDYHYYRRPHLSLGRDHYYSYIDRYRRPMYRHHAGNYWYPHRYRHGARPRHRNHRQHRYGGPHDHNDFDRHQRKRDHRDGRRRDRSDGDRRQQREQIAADNDRDVTRTERRERRRQLEGMKRKTRNPARDAEAVPANNGRVIAQGTARDGIPRARVTRERNRADRPRRENQRVARIDRHTKPRERVVMNGADRDHQRTATIERARQLAKLKVEGRVLPVAVAKQKPKRHAAQQPRARRPARQARMNLPNARSKRSQTKQSQAKQSQPRQVATGPKRSRSSAMRSSSRAANNHGVATRSKRSRGSASRVAIRRTSRGFSSSR